jgi:predicted DNA-binding WGR domain protein
MSATSLSLRRIRSERNERRFYRMEVTIDLFGTVLLQRHWGRIGTDGRSRFEPFSDAATAEAALIRLAATKRRRGYRDVLTPSQ